MECMKEMSNSILDEIFQNGCTDSKCQRVEAKETDYIGIPLAKRQYYTAEQIKNISGGDNIELTDTLDDSEINAVSTEKIQERFNLSVIRVADIIYPEEVSSKDYEINSNKNCADNKSTVTNRNNSGGSVTEEDSLKVQVEGNEHVENYTTATASVPCKTYKECAQQQIAKNEEIHDNNAAFLSNSESNITALSADIANNCISEHDGNDSVINSDFESINIKTEHVDPEIENLACTSELLIVDVRSVRQNKQSNETGTVDSFNVENKQTTSAIEDNEKTSSINSKQVVTNNTNEADKQSEYAETSDCVDACETQSEQCEQSEDMNDLRISTPTEVYMDIDHDGDGYCSYDYFVTNNFPSYTHAATDVANGSDLQEQACVDVSDTLCSSFVSKESSDSDEPVKFLNSGTGSNDQSKENSDNANKETLKDKVIINNIKVVKDSKCKYISAPDIASKTAKVVTKQPAPQTQSFQKKVLLPKNRMEKELRSSYTFSNVNGTMTDNGNMKQNRNCDIKGKRKLDSANDGIVGNVKKSKYRYADLTEENNKNEIDNNTEISDKISNRNKKISTNEDKKVKENKHEMNKGCYKIKGNYCEGQGVEEMKCSSKKSNNSMSKTETLPTGIKLKEYPLSEKDNKIVIQQDSTRTDSLSCNSYYRKGELTVSRDINSKFEQGSKRRNSGEKHNSCANKVLKNSPNEVDRDRKVKEQNTKNHGTDKSVCAKEVKRYERCVNEMKRPCKDKEIFEKRQPVCNNDNRKVSDKSKQNHNECASNSLMVMQHSACEVNDKDRIDSGLDSDKVDDKSNAKRDSLLHLSKISKRRNSGDDDEVNHGNSKKIKTTTDEYKCKENSYEKQDFNQTTRNLSNVQKDIKNKLPKPYVLSSDTEERIWKWLSAGDEKDIYKIDHQKNTSKKALQVKLDFKIPKKSDEKIRSKVETRTTSVNSSTENCGDRGISVCQEITKEPQIETISGKKNRQKLSKNDDCKHTVNNCKIAYMDEVTPMELVHEAESKKADKKTKDAHLINSSKQSSVQKNSDRSKQLVHKSSDTTNKERNITFGKANAEKTQHRHKSGNSDKSERGENKSQKYSDDKTKQPDKYEDKIVSVSSDAISKAINKTVEIVGDRNNMNSENIPVHEVNRAQGVNTRQKLSDDSKYFVKDNDKVVQPKEVGRKNNTHIVCRKPGGSNFTNRENEKILNGSLIADLDEEKKTLKCSEHGRDKKGDRIQEKLNKKENKSNATDATKKQGMHQCKTCKNAFFTYFEDLKKHEVKCISTVRGTEKDPKCNEVKRTGNDKTISTVVSKTSVECDALSRKSPVIRERSSSVVESDSLKGDKSNLSSQNSCAMAGKKTNEVSVNFQSEKMNNQSLIADLDEEQTTSKCFEHGQDKKVDRIQEKLNKKENKSNATDATKKQGMHQCKTCKNAFFTYFEDLKKHEVKCISTVCGTEKDPKCNEVKGTSNNKIISTDVSKTSVECDALSRKSPAIRERSSSVVESDSLKGDKSDLGSQNSCAMAGKKTNEVSVNIQSEKINKQSVRNSGPLVNNDNQLIECKKCEKSWFSNEYHFKIHQQKCFALNKKSESAHCCKKDSNLVKSPNSKATGAMEKQNKRHDHDAEGSHVTKFIPPFERHMDLHTNQGFNDGSHPDCSLYPCSRGNDMCRFCKNAFFRCRAVLMNHVRICRKKIRAERWKRHFN